MSDVQAHSDFYAKVMGFSPLGNGIFKVGESVLILEQDDATEPAGHWVNLGCRYFTLHVMRVDDCFQAVCDAGAAVGERPYSIGKIARISFVRDPDLNWIEVAQRASLAGPWWDE